MFNATKNNDEEKDSIKQKESFQRMTTTTTTPISIKVAWIKPKSDFIWMRSLQAIQNKTHIHYRIRITEVNSCVIKNLDEIKNHVLRNVNFHILIFSLSISLHECIILLFFHYFTSNWNTMYGVSAKVQKCKQKN